MRSHTALLHPSEMGIARAVPGREQGQTGTDILPWALEPPHTGYVPGEWGLAHWAPRWVKM